MDKYHAIVRQILRLESQLSDEQLSADIFNSKQDRLKELYNMLEPDKRYEMGSLIVSRRGITLKPG